MQHNSIKIAAALVVAAVIAAVGYTAYQFGSLPDRISDILPSKQIVPASGYITFTAHEEGTDRNYPQAFDVTAGEFIEIPNSEDTFYIESEPNSSGYAYIQAPYLERAPDDLYYPYEGSPMLISGDDTVVLGVINPSNLSKSSSDEKFAFHALSRILTSTTEPEFYYAPENYQDSENWAIYVVDTELEEVSELAKGHSPVWSSDGRFLFYLSVDGLNLFDVSSRMTWSIASLPERLPTPASSLSLSKDGNTLYVLTTSTAVSPDRLFVYDVSSIADADFENVELNLKRMIDMPEGKHSGLDVSPDENYASAVTYGAGFFEVHSFNLQTSEIQKETLFKWSGLKKYYHYPYASWTTLSPTEFD
jgi:hypothetical protein